MSLRRLLPSLVIVAPLFAQSAKDRPGYEDTPVLPGQPWRVHDKQRPYPPVVKPAPATAPVAPPADAVVLLGVVPAAADLDAWTGKGGRAQWLLDEQALVANKTGDIETRAAFGDVQIHLEWSAPRAGKSDGQARGNSGVFLMGQYEIQILDSFESPTYADGQAAALYGQMPPLVNASRPGGEWQTFDIVFRAPRFDGEALRSPATVTVLHNGVLVHDHQEVFGATAHRSLPKYRPHAAEGPIRLQDHGDPVRFRNVWVRRLEPRAAGPQVETKPDKQR